MKIPRSFNDILNNPKLDDTSTKKIWMFRRMISCRMIWSFLVTAIRHFIFLHVCFLLLFWRECRILLIISQFFCFLISTPCLYFTVHYSNSWGSGIVEAVTASFDTTWYEIFWKLQSSSVLMDDILLTNAVKSHAINHQEKGCIKLCVDKKYQWKPSPTFYIGKHNDNHYWNAINRKLLLTKNIWIY